MEQIEQILRDTIGLDAASIGSSMIERAVRLRMKSRNIRKSAELYADTLRQTKVFLNLPSLSQLLVTKVYEVMACGAMLVAPLADAPMQYDPIRWLYNPRQPMDAATLLASLSPEKIQEQARMGCEEVHRNHRLEKRIEIMLSKVSSPIVA